MPRRPNILYIFTDQQEARAMSCAANRDIRTPAIDSIAERGVRFEKAYCTFPLCTPSRASMFTGMMPHQIGIDRNGQAIAEDRRLAELGHVLSSNGYECVYGGKWHIPEIAIPDGHGFRRICGFTDWELPKRCAEFILQEHAKPFFLVAAFDNPHNICEWSREQPLPWGPVEKAPPGECPDLPPNFAVSDCEPEALRCEQQALPMYRARAFTPDDWRCYRYAHYRLVEKVDAGIMTILTVLRNTGQDTNTLIIFSSDHGDGMGAHQWNQKSALYEECTRVPLIVAPPGQRTLGRTDSTHLVSNGLDLYPTICDYAGVHMPPGPHGLSLRPVLEAERSNEWRQCVVVETLFDGGLGTHGLMMRTGKYKYCLYSWGKYREQLFDLENDPGEMVNLAGETSCQPELQQHRDMLARWIEETDYRQGTHYAHPRVRPLVPGQEYPSGEGRVRANKGIHPTP
ncbi:MAG: sulfatase-like hydrolase/transferase [Lentisphaerae bacterium]|nr:sulfatase-like hydrolase/transferase [Lentisphaerota bacterium]